MIKKVTEGAAARADVFSSPIAEHTRRVSNFLYGWEIGSLKSFYAIAAKDWQLAPVPVVLSTGRPG